MTKRALNPKRLSARDASRFVLGKLHRDDAQDLFLRFRVGGPSLTSAERAAFVALLKATGIDAAMYELGYAMTLGEPEKSDEPGRRGRPPRVWLRRELRALRATLARAIVASDERHVSRVMASLLLVYGFDRHGVWWSSERPHPPTGDGRYGRVGWLVKRIGDLCDDADTGQYGRRAQVTTKKRPPKG